MNAWISGLIKSLIVFGILWIVGGVCLVFAELSSASRVSGYTLVSAVMTMGVATTGAVLCWGLAAGVHVAVKVSDNLYLLAANVRNADAPSRG